MLVLARFSHPKSPLHLFSRGSELLPDSRRRFESDHLELSGAGWLTLTYYNIGGVWSGLWRAEEEGRLGCADNGTELNPPHQTDGISGQARPY